MTTEFFQISREETNISVAGSEVTAVAKKRSQCTAARVYENGKLAVMGMRGEPRREELESAARAQLASALAYEAEPTAGVARSHAEESVFARPEEFLREVELSLQMLRSAFPGLVFSHKATHVRETVLLENSLSTRLSDASALAQLEFIIQRSNSANIIDFYVGYSTKAWNRETAHREIHDWCSAFLHPIPPPAIPKRIPVLFLEPGTILGYFAQHLDARAFLASSSAFLGKLNSPLFSERFTLEVKRTPGTFSTIPFFDHEGTVHEGDACALVERGRLLRPFADKRVGRAGGFLPTGSAQGAFDAVPQTGAAGLTVASTHARICDLLGGEPSLVVVSAGGGDFNSDGGFASPVQMAFWWDGEKIAGFLPECQVRGELKSMFGEDYLGATAEYPLMPGMSGCVPPLVACRMEVSF